MFEDTYLSYALLINPHGRCGYCRKWGHVGLITDPYDAEIYDETEWVWYHEECAKQAWLDT